MSTSRDQKLIVSDTAFDIPGSTSASKDQNILVLESDRPVSVSASKNKNIIVTEPETSISISASKDQDIIVTEPETSISISESKDQNLLFTNTCLHPISQIHTEGLQQLQLLHFPVISIEPDHNVMEGMSYSTSTARVMKKKAEKRRSYSLSSELRQHLLDAVQLYTRDGGSYQEGHRITMEFVANKYGIPKSVLERRINNKISMNAGLGRHPLFTKEVEDKLVTHLLKMADIGYGYDKLQALSILWQCSRHQDDPRFADFKATIGYFHRLQHRYPKLT